MSRPFFLVYSLLNTKLDNCVTLTASNSLPNRLFYAHLHLLSDDGNRHSCSVKEQSKYNYRYYFVSGGTEETDVPNDTTTMSKLSDYSKFDHLRDDDDSTDDDELHNSTQQRLLQGPPSAAGLAPPVSESAPAREATAAVAAAAVAGAVAVVHRSHPVRPNRFIFEYNGVAIYEWEQSLSEVVLYVPAPPPVVVVGATVAASRNSNNNNNGAQQMVCTISAHRLQLGLQNAAQFFLDESTFAAVDTKESTWCFEDDDDDGKKVIAIYLHKAAKGAVWEAPLKGRFSDAVLDPASLQQVQKELMLERWQEENPGMDFRGAEFNGSAPDPRTFMGGVKYD